MNPIPTHEKLLQQLESLQKMLLGSECVAIPREVWNAYRFVPGAKVMFIDGDSIWELRLTRVSREAQS